MTESPPGRADAAIAGALMLAAMIACAAVGLRARLPRRGLRCRSAWSGCSRASAWVLRLSTLAIEGSSSRQPQRPGRARWRCATRTWSLLALALPVFLVAGLADARLCGRRRGLARPARRSSSPPTAAPRARSPSASETRRSACSARPRSRRVWLVTLAILLVGLLGDREDGLAAALLSRGPGHRLTSAAGRWSTSGAEPRSAR